MTSPSAQFTDLAHHCRVAQDLTDDVHRWLGDLADLVRPSIDMVAHRNYWHMQLWVVEPAETLRDSAWHKVVMRLNEFFPPPIITRGRGGSTLRATYDTAFGFDIVVACTNYPVAAPPTEMTLDEVLAEQVVEVLA